MVAREIQTGARAAAAVADILNAGFQPRLLVPQKLLLLALAEPEEQVVMAMVLVAGIPLSDHG